MSPVHPVHQMPAIRSGMTNLSIFILRMRAQAREALLSSATGVRGSCARERGKVLIDMSMLRIDSII
jgi:hypothetical protein